MGRKKKPPGKRITLYLSAEQLATFHGDPAQAIRDWINSRSPKLHVNNMTTVAMQEARTRPKGVCPRHARQLYTEPVPRCPNCNK